MWVKKRLYESCVRSAMLYASETWAVTQAGELGLELAENRMFRRMCGWARVEGVSNEDVRQLVGVEGIVNLMRRGRLRWYVHLVRREEDDGIRKCMSLEEVKRPLGRPKLTWEKVIEKDRVSE